MKNIFNLKELSRRDIPPVSEIQKLFENTSEEDFAGYVDFIIENQKKQRFDELMYYLRLFRNNPHVQSCLNSPEVPVRIIENLVLYSYGFMSLKYDQSEIDDILDEVLFFLSPERLMQLLLETNYLARDMQFVFFILAKLDNYNIDVYFKETKHLDKILSVFIDLPEQVLNDIIFKNPFLFEYISSILPAFYKDERAQHFSSRYEQMFTKMKDIKTLIRKYKMKTKENSDWRSIERLALLVSIIKKTEESGIALSSYNDAAFSRSDTEVKLAHEIISNSIFSDVLVKVNSCAVCENEEFILF